MSGALQSMSDAGAPGNSLEAAAPKPPVWLFSLQLFYLVALVALWLLYEHVAALHRFLPDPAGPIPLSVPWWGAVGGVTISLTGIFKNAKHWDPSYQSWHIARPFLGGVVGSVGFLIFVVVIRSTGADPTANSTVSRAAFDLIAFLVGYREEVFRELLKRATDVLLAPGRRDTRV